MTGVNHLIKKNALKTKKMILLNTCVGLNDCHNTKG
jgi:hypothetical protein